MKKSILFSSVSVLAVMVHVQAGELVLRYDAPANDTMTEALPVGNGMLGGMIHGKPEFERVVLNDISLWTGDEKTATGGYDEMGSYQTLGILNIDTLAKSGAGESKVPMVVCASGQESFYQSENIEASTDNNVGTKWCVVPDGVPLIWELRLSEARVVSQYVFTSAGDVQERDPSTWTFSGSNNGKEWTVLDNHTNAPPMEKRCAVKTFTCANDTAYKFYRLTFAPKKGVMHFQIAEISIPGVVFPGKAAPEKVENYSRALDLSTATHRVTYKAGDVTYCRETFASAPDQVMVMRLTADKPGACGGAVMLKGGHREVTLVSKNELQFSGVLANNLKYMTSVRVLNEGGSVQAGEGLIYYTACDSVTILLAASTDYTSDHSTQYRGGNPKAVVEKRLAKVAKKKYDVLKAAHIKEFQSYFNRVELDVGATSQEQLALPTNKRKSLHAEKGGDADLEELMFQYGRYLLISCSRPGGLPANLQGMWNDNNNPAWHSDYHANINVQMNYWLAEQANLSECHTTFLDLIVSQLPAWRKATAEANEFKSTTGKPVGWAVRTSHGINGDMGWQWDITANAWYCQHFWWHYAYTGDKTWLKNVAYPIMKEICEFWEVRMKALPDGTLVVPNGWSPEHGPVEDGVSYNQEICWDLFNNYVEASEALGVDVEYRKKISEMRDKLMVPKIGNWGQLQEWMVDRDDPNDHHRHTSHLFGLFPGEQFSVAQTPVLAAGAKKSLDARGPVGDVREWSFAWRTALYARLREGESAYTMFRNLLNERNTCLNLFGNHPPMQMDGNFGITAGVCEMLMQSYTDTIELLPAIPKAWPTGSVKGLKARGNFTVDISWDQGKVTAYSIRSTTSREVKVRVNGEEKTIKTKGIDAK